LTSDPSLRILDDPERLLYIRASGDFRGYRAIPVAKEPWTYDWLKDLSTGDVLYDIGANVGSYSLMAGARGAAVYAFEPLPVNYAELIANVHLNSLSEKIYCYPIAATNSYLTSWIPFSVHDINLPGYGLASAEKQYKGSEDVYLPSAALDALPATAFKPPTHVKIDVEGAEFHVLDGMQGILSAGSIKSLVIEIADDRTEIQIKKLMERHGYYGEEAEDSRRSGENRTLIYEQES
jgi:FkbM family methyltransferase